MGTARDAITTALRRTDGAVFVEYVTLLLLVTIGAAAGFAALGIPLVKLYRFAQMIIAIPFP